MIGIGIGKIGFGIGMIEIGMTGIRIGINGRSRWWGSVQNTQIQYIMYR